MKRTSLPHWRAKPVSPADGLAVTNESEARGLVGRLAVLASAAALRATAPAAVADAFLQTRLADPHGAIYGTSALGDLTIELLLQRALPEA